MKTILILFFLFISPGILFSQWKDGGIIKPRQIFVEYLTVTKKLTFGPYTMPMLDGTSGQGLVTDGHGRLTWNTFSTPPGPSVFDSTWFDYGVFAKKQRSKRDTVQINYLVPLEIRLDTNGFLSFTEYQLDLLSHKIIAISAFKPGNSDGSYLVLNPTYVNTELASLKSGSKASVGTTADYGDGITSVVFFTAQGAGFLKQMNFDSTGFYPAPYTGPVNFGRRDQPIDTIFADHVYPPLTTDLDWVQDSIDRHTDSIQAHNLRLLAFFNSLALKWNLTDTSANKKLAAYFTTMAAIALKANIASPTFTGSVGFSDLDGTGNIITDSTIVPGIKANGNSSTAINIYLTQGNTQTVTRTGSCTYTLIGAVEGGSYRIKFKHEASTSVYTVTFSPSVLWSSGTSPTFTNTSNAVDFVSIIYVDGAFYGMQQPDFK